MRAILALLILLVALPASAGERLPWIDRPVPELIPADMCVRLVWSPSTEQWKNGKLLSVFRPPLTQDIRALLEEARQKEWGKLEQCSSGNA